MYVTNELIRRVIEPGADPRVVGNRAHQDEHRDYRESVVREACPQCLSKEVESSVDGDHIGKSHEADKSHHITNWHPKKKKNEENRDSEHSRRGKTHRCIARATARRSWRARTRLSARNPNPKPYTKG